MKYRKIILVQTLFLLFGLNVYSQKDENIYLNDSIYYYDWDFELNDWIVSTKEVYFYVLNGNIVIS